MSNLPYRISKFTTRCKETGKKYTYYRITYTSIDPTTGKQLQKSVTGKSRKDVIRKYEAKCQRTPEGSLLPPSEITVKDFLSFWEKNYTVSIKSGTKASYAAAIDNHIIPALGRYKLCELITDHIQAFYNSMYEPASGEALSAKTVKNIHGILHRALQQAVANHYIPSNPSDSCILKPVRKEEIHPLQGKEIPAFLNVIHDSKYEAIYQIAIFTGMREGEILGLTWDCVDFDNHVIHVKQQLQYNRQKHQLEIVLPKNSKSRTIVVAKSVVQILRKVKNAQDWQRLEAGSGWADNNLVFCSKLGDPLRANKVYESYKKFVTRIGRPDARFHDLRHTYATICLRNGDDIKTLSHNLGHSSCSFTLDVYGHCVDDMKFDSASRMDRFIERIGA